MTRWNNEHRSFAFPSRLHQEKEPYHRGRSELSIGLEGGMTRTVTMGLVLYVLLAATPGEAQQSDELTAVRKEIEQIKEGQRRLQKELQDLKGLMLKAGGAVTQAEDVNSELNIANAPTKGLETARVTIVEFADYYCPYCAHYARETFPLLDGDYIKSGLVRYAIKDFPIQSLHPKAEYAAQVARCAGDQGKYWDMHDYLYKRPKASKEMVNDYVRTVGLEMGAFEACITSHKYQPLVRADVLEGQRIGVTGTPTFFLALTPASNDTSVKAVKAFRGEVSYTLLKAAIDELLRR